ncbi:hypothetical protein X777_01519, partial [Ooceraea biroi]
LTKFYERENVEELQTRAEASGDDIQRHVQRSEAESKSGSGASQRKSFAFYENMKFLQDHVQRRRTFTNISQKKDKENVTTKVPHSNLNLAIHRPTVSTTSTTR